MIPEPHAINSCNDGSDGDEFLPEDGVQSEVPTEPVTESEADSSSKEGAVKNTQHTASSKEYVS